MKKILKPNIGIGEIAIGTSIDFYLDKYNFEFVSIDNTDWEEYDFDGVEVYFDKSSRIIQSIGCRELCEYDGLNLIGSSFVGFCEKLNINPSEAISEEITLEQDETQTVYEVDNLSLQIWVDLNGLIKAVFVIFYE